MERAIGGVAIWGIGAHAHPVRVGEESDGTNSRIDVLVHFATNDTREVGLGRALKLVLPRNGVVAEPGAVTLDDAVTTSNGAVGANHAGQPAFEIRQYSTLPLLLIHNGFPALALALSSAHSPHPDVGTHGAPQPPRRGGAIQ